MHIQQNPEPSPRIGLDEFTRQYLETALWSSSDSDDTPLDKNYSVDDFAPSALRQAVANCLAFQDKAGALLSEIETTQAAHDFWLTRTGHGAGFWSRGRGGVGDKLTEIAKSFGSLDPYVGDDGMVYFSK